MMRWCGAILLLALALPLHADTILLKNKSRVEGRITSEKDGTVVIETYDLGPVTIRKDEILQIRRGASRLDKYDKKAGEIEETADGHYELGNWCKRTGLPYRARLEWQVAIEKDPDHQKARKALGHVKVGDKWLTEEEYQTSRGYVKYQGKWIKKSAWEKIRLKNAVEIKLTVAVKPDADKKWLEYMKGKIETAAEKWWECTEGQMYISQAHIVDRTATGDVVINNLDDTHCDSTAWGRTDGTTVYLGGKFPQVTFCHEMGHRWFGLPEEYVEPKCASCVMEPWKGIFAFCDETNHTGKGEDCWKRILKRYKKWRHPNKGSGERPPIRITIEDK